jgi:hypothetical protein
LPKISNCAEMFDFAHNSAASLSISDSQKEGNCSSLWPCRKANLKRFDYKFEFESRQIIRLSFITLT